MSFMQAEKHWIEIRVKLDRDRLARLWSLVPSVSNIFLLTTQSDTDLLIEPFSKVNKHISQMWNSVCINASSIAVVFNHTETALAPVKWKMLHFYGISIMIVFTPNCHLISHSLHFHVWEGETGFWLKKPKPRSLGSGKPSASLGVPLYKGGCGAWCGLGETLGSNLFQPFSQTLSK